MTTAVPCPCPWFLLPQHTRAVGIESGNLADFGWMVESLIRRVDGAPPGFHDFPVGPDELVRFAAFHEWADRQAVMDLMEDLAFLLHFYRKGFFAWHRRVATWAWVATLRARHRGRRRARASEHRVFTRLRDSTHRLGHAQPSKVETAVLLDRDLRERLVRARQTDPSKLQRHDLSGPGPSEQTE